MIKIENLVKRRGPKLILDRVHLRARPGAVTGFLGANGAGKSSALRILLGVDHATSGTATIGGQRYRDLQNPLRRVGTVFDSAGAHPSRTGVNHLRWVAQSNGIRASRIDEVLHLTDLFEARNLAVKKYSLGMGRRLGIATALLGDPEIIIMDEPTNGLDPDGIRWLRTLIRAQVQRGGTVLLSSHLMFEVEEVADEVVIISRGRTLAQGSLAQIRGQHQNLEEAFFALTGTEEA